MIDFHLSTSPKKMSREELERHLEIYNGNIIKLKPGGAPVPLTQITKNRTQRKKIGEETKVIFPKFVLKASK